MSSGVRCYQRLPDGILLKTTFGSTRLQLCGDRIIRVIHSPSLDLSDSISLAVIERGTPPADRRLGETEGRIVIATRKVEARIDFESGLVSFHAPSGDVILGEDSLDMTPIEVGGEDAYSVELKFSISGGERLYGLGQHPGIFNYNGHAVTLVQKNTEVAIPFLVSSRGYGILWDNCSLTRVSSFREGEGCKLSWWSEVADAVDYYFIYGPRLDDVIASYRRLTGGSPMLPRWAYGYWQSKERYGSQEELLSVAREFKRREIPIDVIVQDWKYWGKYGWNALKFDEDLYPDPAEMVRELHGMGFKVMISIWPRFGTGTEVYRKMAEEGCILPGTTCYDPFGERGRRLYWSRIRRAFLDIGVDAWWLDATEPEAADPETGAWNFFSAFHDTRTAMGPGARYLNAYSLMTTRAVYEGQRGASNKRVLILTRSSFAGQQRYAAVTWSGDILSDWDELRRQIPAGLNFCLSGVPYWTTDIGGFFSGSPASGAYREVFIRWFQWGAFCPIFRVHGTMYAKEPWRFGPEAEKILVRYIKLRYRLLPYIYSLAWKVASEGYTMMRALVMDFPHDPRALDIDDEYMFGPFLLVCPVTLPGVRERRVYLPETPGGWYDFWTGRRLGGGQVVRAPAPLDLIPLYVKAGSIIPMGPFLQYSDEKPPDPLELRIYPGADGTFMLYEDDGETYDYEKGMRSTISMGWDDEEGKLIIGERKGSFPGMLEDRTFHLVRVREGHGIGLGTAKPDAVVKYGGKHAVIEVKVSGL